MKLSIAIFTTLFISTMSLQAQHTFIYELRLFERFRHRSQWSQKEHAIQQEHVAYLDSLTKAGKLQLAGIIDQGLENHTGFVILTTDSYEEALEISQHDPSIKQGMMTAHLLSINIYFRKEQ